MNTQKNKRKTCIQLLISENHFSVKAKRAYRCDIESKQFLYYYIFIYFIHLASNHTSIVLYDGGAMNKMTLFYFTDKAPSIWDDYLHTKKIKRVNPYLKKKSYTSFHRGSENFDKNENDDNLEIVNGDIACDSYNKIDEDVKNLVELGVRIQFYDNVTSTLLFMLIVAMLLYFSENVRNNTARVSIVYFFLYFCFYK